MKLRTEQLAAHLSKILAPIYVISGDEPLLVEEACQEIRAKAKTAGFPEREVLAIKNDFDWQQGLTELYSLSLFHPKRFIELRFLSNKPNEAGSKALQELTAKALPHVLLLITFGKVDAATQRTKWWQNLEQKTILIQVWPITPADFPRWLTVRLQRQQLSVTPEGLALLVELLEGNLLAATQEIEKLRLLYGPGQLSAAQISQALIAQGNYTVFDLADSCLQGEAERAVRIVKSLAATGIEPPLVLWALLRDLRRLLLLAEGTQHGHSLAALFKTQGIWDKQQPLFKQALSRHRYADLQALLLHAQQIDCMIKGIAPGQCWNELTALALALSGTKPRTSGKRSI